MNKQLAIFTIVTSLMVDKLDHWWGTLISILILRKRWTTYFLARTFIKDI